MTNPNSVVVLQQAKESLKHILNSVTQISEDKLDQVVDLFELVTYKKNFKIIEEGSISDHFYFIYKGIIKVCYYKNDRVVVERFEKEGGFFGGNFTHLTKKPGTNFYESIEEVTLLRLKFSQLEVLCNESHEIERLYRVVIELFHTNFAERLTIFKSTSTEERYHEFIQQNCDTANRVSLKDIANYLDMTSETISRIRGKFDKQNKN